jgi:serine/threonine-protein kinase
VAFWASGPRGTNGAIKKIPLGGGTAQESLPPPPTRDVTSGPSIPPSGLAWDAAGHLYAGSVKRPVWQIIPGGGAPARVTRVTALGEGEIAHGLPSLLPGGNALLFTVRKRIFTWGDEEVAAIDLRTGQRRLLLKDAADARYVPSGHLAFLRRGALFAVPFDADAIEIQGNEEQVLGDLVAQAVAARLNANVTGAGQFENS